MRALTLTFVLLLLTGCGDDASPPDLVPDAGETIGDAGDTVRDAGSDADAGELPLIEPRREPACEPLGRVESANVPSLALESDFFTACQNSDGQPIPDRAFTWTAPASGLYVFALSSSSEWDARLALELRRGDCALTEHEGGEARADEQICAGSFLTENGSSPPYQVLGVEQGETITMVVEGDDYYLQQDPEEVMRQVVGLTVYPAECPSAEERFDGGEWVAVDELPSHAPVYFEIASTASNGHELRELSCIETSNTRQYGVAWTAPEAGRYAFEVEATVPVGIAVLEETCSGDELACASDELLADLSLELEAGQRVILMVEIDGFSDDDEDIALRIHSETATPEHAECEPLGDGSTLTAAAFRTSNHFFPSCEGGKDLPDKAFTWRALESGRYAFWLLHDAIFGGAEIELMLLHGDCVMPTDVVPICAERQWKPGPNDDIPFFHEVIEVEAGEVITIVANADDEYLLPDVATIEPRRQSLTLRVEPL